MYKCATDCCRVSCGKEGGFIAWLNEYGKIDWMNDWMTEWLTEWMNEWMNVIWLFEWKGGVKESCVI